MASLVRRALDAAAGIPTPPKEARVAESIEWPDPTPAPARARRWGRRTRTIPLPRRGDHVEAWLKQQRDQFNPGSPVWIAFDQQLDDYQLHADTRTPLHEHCCEGGNIHDCAGCYDAKEARRG